MNDLKEKTLRGGLAKIFNQAIIFFIRLGSVAVMARLLDPKDFGLVAMATVITGVFNIFTTAGLSSATVQRDTVTDDQVSTLFWINIMVGAFLALLCILTAPVLAYFYKEPRLTLVTLALAAGFIFNAAGVQHSALLQRQMRFYALTVIETVSLSLSIVIGIAMAATGFGYWAIVAATISNPAISTICKWQATGWIPGKLRRGTGVRPMLRFGGTLTLNGFVVYLAYNFEKILLGRYWGAEVLGLYGRAYSLINIPTENLNSAVASVAFSALARTQNDHERLKNYFLKGYSLVMSMTLPITICCALFADDIIFVFLGAKWKGAVILFRLMTPTVLIFGMINPLGWLLQSIGMQDRSLKIAFVIAPVVIMSYIVGLPYGPSGVAFAYSAAMILLVIPVLGWCIHGTIFTSKDILSAIGPPFLSGLVAAAVTLAFRFFCDQFWAPFLRLALGGCVMMGSYVFTLFFLMGQKSFYLDLLHGLKGNPDVASIDV